MIPLINSDFNRSMNIPREWPFVPGPMKSFHPAFGTVCIVQSPGVQAGFMRSVSITTGFQAQDAFLTRTFGGKRMKPVSMSMMFTTMLLISLSYFSLSQAEESRPAYQPEADAEPELISGEVISLCNYLAKGHHGDSHTDESQFLVESRGLPVAILGQDGAIYVAILKGFKSANEKLAPLIGKNVNALGVVRRHPGANLIEIQIVSEALD